MEIDESLRNRIVGASVVTFLAMIFLPMLLNDPKEDDSQIELLTIPKKLADSPSLTATILPDNVNDVVGDIAMQTVKDDALQPLVTASKKNLPGDDKPKKLLSPVLNTPISDSLQAERWFIQVASFNREENAVAFRDKLRGQGFAAIVSTALLKGRTVYRLRVGPELSKQRAKVIKMKLNQLNNVKSIVILSH